MRSNRAPSTSKRKPNKIIWIGLGLALGAIVVLLLRSASILHSTPHHSHGLDSAAHVGVEKDEFEQQLNMLQNRKVKGQHQPTVLAPQSESGSSPKAAAKPRHTLAPHHHKAKRPHLSTPIPDVDEGAEDVTTAQPLTPRPGAQKHSKVRIPINNNGTGGPSVRVDDPSYHGVDLDTKDHKTRPKPGGTEREALTERRRLGRANWPLLPPGEMSWRSGGRAIVPKGLQAVQGQLDATVKLEYDDALSKCQKDADDWRCLLKHYKALKSDHCDGIYGHGLVKRFRNNRHSLCTMPGSAGQVGSQLSCYSVRASSEHSTDTAICQGDKVAVDFDKITNGDFPWLNFHKGAFPLQCAVNSEAKKHHWEFIHCLKDWMDLGFEAKPERKVSCDVTVKEPTYFMTRSGDYSPFALTHDWFNSMLLYAVEDVNPSEVSVVMMDRMTVGFYTPVWQMLFGPHHQLQWYPDLTEKYKGQTVCYEQAWFNIPARLSPIYNKDDCKGSSLYRLYRDLVLSSVGAMRVAPMKKHLIVNVIVRRNYQTGHTIGRRFGNGPELIKKLRGIGSVKVGSQQVKVVVNEVDFAEMDFDQQLRVSRATDVLVAMHGAGLAQMMFMHDHGGVFEFFCPEKPSSNFRYEQLSLKMGLEYNSFSIDNEKNIVPVAQALGKLKRLFQSTAERKQLGIGEHQSDSDD